jgi:hypothetical protein
LPVDLMGVIDEDRSSVVCANRFRQVPRGSNHGLRLPPGDSVWVVPSRLVLGHVGEAADRPGQASRGVPSELKQHVERLVVSHIRRTSP